MWRFFFLIRYPRLSFVCATIIILCFRWQLYCVCFQLYRAWRRTPLFSKLHPIHQFSRVPHHHQHNCIAYCWITRCSWLRLFFFSLSYFVFVVVVDFSDCKARTFVAVCRSHTVIYYYFHYFYFECFACKTL